jgi:hypothetical protein
MEARAPEMEKALRRNKAVWFGELHRVRAKCRNENSPVLEPVETLLAL